MTMEEKSAKKLGRDALLSTFGMYEMEVAAIRIINRCAEQGSWVLPHLYTDMVGDTEQHGFQRDMEEKGYLHLLHRGYFFHSHRKGYFYVNQDFVDRVSKKVNLALFGLSLVAPSFKDTMEFEYPTLKAKCTLCDGLGVMEDPHHGHAFTCSACGGSGRPKHD